jgi:hypothetical protein
MLGADDLFSVRRLKECVLSREGGTFAAVRLPESGGAGKSTACLVVANDDDVKRRSPDTMLWIQLGDSASAPAIVDQVAAIVRATGGHSFADNIRTHGEKKLEEMIKSARQLFEDKSILLVADNFSSAITTLSH